jgi:hypothetical protein
MNINKWQALRHPYPNRVHTSSAKIKSLLDILSSFLLSQQTSLLAVCHEPRVLTMTVITPIELVNSVNCPKCGYNNISGKRNCEGTLADGSVCGVALPTVA